MAVIPNRTQDQLDFFDQHAPLWATHAEAIGITPAQANAFVAAAADARYAWGAQLAARSTYHGSVKATRKVLASTRSAAADIIRSIRAFAEQQENPTEVYNLAQIPQPAAPKPVPPPALPTDFRVSIGQNGNLVLRWRANNPRSTGGTVYLVERRLDGAGPFTLLGTCGAEKRFNDTTLPAGTAQAEYRVTGQRSGVAGPAAIWTVRLGTEAGAGGQATVVASVTPGADAGPTRLAA